MSKYEFKLPDIGEGVSEGEIVGWLVREGDSVAENQDMVEVMTDKATVTIGAPKAGRVVQLRGKEGDVVPVGDVLLVLDVEGAGALDATASEHEREPKREAGNAPEVAEARVKQERQPAQQEHEARAAEVDAVELQQEGPAATAVGDLREALPGMSVPRSAPADHKQQGSGNGYFTDKPLAAPATRRFARELGVDLKRVEPSGAGGRVTREDVERFQERTAARGADQKARPSGSTEVHQSEHAAEPRAEQPKLAPPPSEHPNDERVPIRGLRKRIFENMARSKHTAAHFTYVDECDATNLRALRERIKPYAERGNVKLSFLPFIVKALVIALKKHPALNCLVDDQAHEMILLKRFDIGIAVATDAGLTVAALRNADRLSLLEIAAETERLVTLAREGKLRKEDLGSTSFTITSLGKLGGLFATPIVNYPEVAILGVHEMKKRPVVKDDQIVIGEVMLLSLSFDHRIIDGHVGAAFAHELIGLLEDPDRVLIES